MKKEYVYYLTYAICLILICISNITYVDDGIHRLTINVANTDLLWSDWIDIFFIVMGVDTTSKFMMRFGI